MGTNFKPNYVVHPGVFLREEMVALKISQKELSKRISVNKTIINEVINGKRRINGELAVKLETVLYSPAKYWLNLQAIYDEAEARLKLCGNINQNQNITCKFDTTKILFGQSYNLNSIENIRGIAS